MNEMAGDFCKPQLPAVAGHFTFHRVKYLSVTRWRSEVRIGAEFHFHQVPGAGAVVAEVEGIRQQLEEGVGASSVFILLSQGPSQCIRVVDELLKVQACLLLLFRSERSAIYGNRKL